jgi:hypothetical protein
MKSLNYVCHRCDLFKKRPLHRFVLVVGCWAVLVPILLFGPSPGFAGPVRELKYRFTMTSPIDSRHLRFKDEFIDAAFKVDSKKIAFSLRNNSGRPIKIKWDEVSYIDPSGESHKCLHEHATAIVPPTAKIKESIIPTDGACSQNTAADTARPREKWSSYRVQTRSKHEHIGANLLASLCQWRKMA